MPVVNGAKESNVLEMLQIPSQPFTSVCPVYLIFVYIPPSSEFKVDAMAFAANGSCTVFDSK